MSSNVTTGNTQVAIYNPSPEVTFKDMRRDPVRYPRLGSLNRDDAVFQMTKIVNNAFMYLGRAVDASNTYYISSHLVDELLADAEGLHAANVSFAEISKIIKRAIMTQEMYAVSVSSLYRIIMDYIRCEGSVLQEEVERERQAKRKDEIRNSVIAPMLQCYAGALVKGSKP